MYLFTFRSPGGRHTCSTMRPETPARHCLPEVVCNMSISALNFHLPRLHSAPAPAVPQPAAPAQPAASSAAKKRDGDKTDITFGQLLKGAVGTVPGAVIDGVGITASTIGHAPKAVVQAYRS